MKFRRRLRGHDRQSDDQLWKIERTWRAKTTEQPEDSIIWSVRTDDTVRVQVLGDGYKKLIRRSTVMVL